MGPFWWARFKLDRRKLAGQLNQRGIRSAYEPAPNISWVCVGERLRRDARLIPDVLPIRSI